MTDFLAEIAPATKAFETAVESARAEIDELKQQLADIKERFDGLASAEIAEVEEVKAKYIKNRADDTGAMQALTKRVQVAENSIELNEMGLAALLKAEAAIRGSVPIETVITALDEEVENEEGNVLPEGAEKILQKCGIERASPEDEETIDDPIPASATYG